MLSHAHMPTHIQKSLEVLKIACVNQTFDYVFLLHNWLCLIKICASSHVTIKQKAVADY